MCDMDDLGREIDLSAWRVPELPPTFADDVLHRMHTRDTALDDELEAMAAELAIEGDEDVAFVRPPTAEARRGRASRLRFAAIALATAAVVLLWLRPAPSRSPVVLEIPPAPVSSAAELGPDDAADLDRDGIRRAVREQFVPEARRCYNALLRRSPSSEGRVSLQFGVIRKGGKGVVDRAEVLPDAEIDDATFHQCLVDAMLAVVFDPPASERVEVVYPIVFRPGESGASVTIE
jgi:hypothetical protein